MAEPTPTYKAILRAFEGCTKDVQEFFWELPYLLNDRYNYEIVIAYVFLKVEQAQNRTLYGGVVKVHRCNSAFAKRVVNCQHLTRDGFKSLFKNTLGKPLPESVNGKVADAEKVRDKVIHGKNVPSAEQRRAIVEVLQYAEALNEEVTEIAGFRPFGNMKGFKGRADSLDNRTSKWVMKGLGFGVKA